MEKLERCASDGMPNFSTLLRDQFVENISDSNLRRELKRIVCEHSDFSLLQIRAEAIRWEREGHSAESRCRSHTLHVSCATQLVAKVPPSNSTSAEITDIKNFLQQQQEQLNQLAESLLALQTVPGPLQPNYAGEVICRRCQRPGHYARRCVNARVGSVSQQPRGYQPTGAWAQARNRTQATRDFVASCTFETANGHPGSQFFHQLHHNHGHQGKERTTELIRQRYYWPGMGQIIKRWCELCERCNKGSLPRERALPSNQSSGRLSQEVSTRKCPIVWVM